MNFKPYINLMRLNKPIGIYLLLWPTLTALFIAGSGSPSMTNLIIFTAGVVVTRSAGCVINDYADRNFDKYVARTKDRPLASGKVSEISALILFVALLVIAVILVLQTNILAVVWSLFAAALMIIYPLIKRISNAPQFILGLAFSVAIPMAFAAETNEVPPGACWLVLATISWAVAYDTMYALVDMKDDLKIGVKSTAILFGDKVFLWIGVFQVLMFICLVLAGVSFNLSKIYYLGLFPAAALTIYHQLLITKQGAYFKAFLHNHWLGFVVLIFTVLSYRL